MSQIENRIETRGRLADNVVHFAQLLRRAGVRIGSDQVIDAVRALGATGVASRDDVYWAMHAVLISRREDRELYEYAFDAFWRDPGAINKLLGMLLPKTKVPSSAVDQSRRVEEALRPPCPASEDEREPGPVEEQIDATMTFSNVVVDRETDFEQMSTDEIEAAKRAIARLRLVSSRKPTRRWRPSRRGHRVDVRRTLQASARSPGSIELIMAERRRRPPPLIVLCDISGSMERYSRMFLHFAHALAAARDRVTAFVFGTALTNVTRALAARDVDRALAALGRDVRDWAGGTRIGACLREFNRTWSRRVLGQGADVLLMTDGLERDATIDLGFEADRLQRSCRRLIWLNPLLRYREFEPRARGVVALLPHVDAFCPVHNLRSIDELARALERV